MGPASTHTWGSPPTYLLAMRASTSSCSWVRSTTGVMDATLKGLLDSPRVLADLARSVDTGLSQDPATVADGSFWAYFHRPDELHEELAEAGFGEIELIAVEGYAWLLGDLDARMTNPEPLLQAIRLTESDPSMLGCSAHVIGIASRP
jgi:hypothetical protein